MDDRRFDALTRALAQGSSRRTALKGLFGGLVGGAAVVTRLDRAGAQAQCEDSSDCPSDICSLWDCIENQCVQIFGCNQGQTCCSDGTCVNAGQCCDDTDCDLFDCEVCSFRTHTCVSSCADGESCCFGTCYNPSDGCCDSIDCGPAPDACSSYTCSDYTCELESNCSNSETCCSDGTCASSTGCCDDSDCSETPCSVCSNNVCVPTCNDPGTICCDNICYNGDSCCLDTGDQCDGEQLECCEDLTCCAYGNFSACAECCSDLECPVNQFCCGSESASGAHCEFCCEDDQCEGDFGYCDDGHCERGTCNVDTDCPNCQSCFEHTCFVVACLQGQTCCNGHACVPDDECDCRRPGETCGEVTITAESPGQYDCCDGSLCCFGQNTNICAQCCSDSDCGPGGTCDDWVCVYPGECDHDRDCPKGTCCCGDGDCSSKCCDKPHPPKPPKPPKPAPPAPSGGGTTLPNTGSGMSNDQSSGLLGAAALGAAAAVLAAKKLRETPDSQTGE